MDAELLKQLNTVAEGMEAMREKVDKAATIDQLDGIDRDTVHKASEAASFAQQAVQDFHAKMEGLDEERKAQESRLEHLEKQLAKARKGEGAVAAPSEYDMNLGGHIRKSVDAQLTPEMESKNLDEIISVQLPYISDAGRVWAKEQLRRSMKSLVTGSDPNGGYWVSAERIPGMIRRIFETSPMRQICSTISTASPMVEIFIDDQEGVATWGNELSVPQNDPTPQVGLAKIAVHNLFGRVTVTENMLEDASIDVVGWLTGKASDKFSRTENTGFMIGTGPDQPRGLLTYPASADPDVYERGTIGRVSSLSSTAGVIQADDVFNLQNHVKEDFQPNGRYLLKRRSWFTLATLKDNQDQYLLRFGDQFSQGAPMLLAGKPITFADDMQDIGVDSIPLAYGDFRSAYTIVDRVGMSILRDPYSQDPLTRFRFRKRVGGGVTNYEAVKLLVLDA